MLGTFAAFGLFLYGVSLVGSVRGAFWAAEPAGAMDHRRDVAAHPSAADWAGLVLMAAMIVLVSLSGRSADRRTDTLSPPHRHTLACCADTLSPPRCFGLPRLLIAPQSRCRRLRSRPHDTFSPNF
ncbi:MAG: hypothetical protein ACLSDQ_11955 [Adlercreutzia equolifaciens]